MGLADGCGGGQQEWGGEPFQGKWAGLVSWIRMEEKEVEDASEFLACVTGWMMDSITVMGRNRRGPGLEGGL